MTASVLIADDEALIRQSVKALLVDEGFEVQAAASGAEAWTRFQEARPDVVLLDLVLGDADGLDLLRRM
ncbi:MAG TPA: response regulator, partial [Polyangia bacterium]|nr:response regulator [Polyangia bacterium]